MKDSTCVLRRSWRAWQLSAGGTAAITAIVLLLAACGGSSSSTGSGTSNAGRPTDSGSPSSQLLAFSGCMQAHGVPNFPSPSSGRNSFDVDAQQLGVSDSRYQAAVTACQGLLPTGGSLQQQTDVCVWFGDCPPTVLQRLLTVERKYARCMRAHGMPDWPDPTVDGGKGRPVFDLSDAGVDPQATDSPQFRSEDRECRSRIGGSVPALPYT